MADGEHLTGIELIFQVAGERSDNLTEMLETLLTGDEMNYPVGVIMPSKTLKIVLLEGTPYGIKLVNLSNWNGTAVIAPRAALKRLKELPEAKMPAVYFLLGKEGRVYVGQTAELGRRLGDHDYSKDFWEEMLAFVSPEIGITEVRQLECLFAKRISQDGLATLENVQQPTQDRALPRALQDVMEEFVDRASDVLLSLGYSLLGVDKDVEAETKESGAPVTCKGPDAEAQGVYSENGILVLKGSKARQTETRTIPQSSKLLRAHMKESGILDAVDDKHFVFTSDFLFSSPSAAADAVLARSANGLTEWKTKEGKTLRELE